MSDTPVVPSAEIDLGRGMIAVVDLVDLPLVAVHRWHTHRSNNSRTFYAVTNATVDGKRKLLPMHRLILQTALPHIDHADGNGLNNRRANLRPATRSENMRNRRAQPHSSTFKGVTAHGDKWQVCIRHEGETIHLGTFEREEDAAKQYDRAARLLHGRFAKTNKMLGLLGKAA